MEEEEKERKEAKKLKIAARSIIWRRHRLKEVFDVVVLKEIWATNEEEIQKKREEEKQKQEEKDGRKEYGIRETGGENNRAISREVSEDIAEHR